MSDVTATSHLSIGEVLALVQEDFPDVTISKIRFLESQGLIAPERTGSGYRKFYEADIDRLRWILRQQRDHFLPLKVIRKMLDEGVDMSEPVDSQPTLWSSTEPEGDAASPAAAGEPDGPGDEGDDPDEERPSTYRSPSHPAVASARQAAPARAETASDRSPAPEEDAGPAGADDDDSAPERSATEAAPVPVARSTDTTPTSSDVPTGPVDVVAEGRERAREAGVPVASPAGAPPADDLPPDRSAATDPAPERPAHSTPADVVAALQEDPRSARRGRRGVVMPAAEDAEDTTPATDEPGTAAATPSTEDAAVTTPPLTALLTAEELCALCDISQELLDGLEQYGLVVPASLGGRSAYDADAVGVAQLASKYAALGVEPRHLRMYKISAEREPGFVEQLVVPLIKQRNPAARQQAVDRCDDLTAMGAELHAALLRRQLGRILGP